MWPSEGIKGSLLLMHVNTCFLKRRFGGIQLRCNRPNRGPRRDDLVCARLLRRLDQGRTPVLRC
jgi:hypothetical protein